MKSLILLEFLVDPFPFFTMCSQSVYFIQKCLVKIEQS